MPKKPKYTILDRLKSFSEEEEQIEESFVPHPARQQQYNNEFWKFVSDQKRWKEIQDKFLRSYEKKHPE